MKLAERITQVQPSATLALTAKIKAMRAEGQDVIGFGAGEPDFDTPKYIIDSAIESIKSGFTRYTPASGIPELKKAVCAKLKRDNGLDYKPENVVINCGAKHSLYNIMQVLLEKGNECIIPAPYWVSYIEQVRLTEATPVIVDTISTNFKITPETLEKNITSNTRMLILNSPSNPTGQVYSKDELAALAEVILKHPDLYVLSDEIYEKLIYDNSSFVSIANISPEIAERTVIINGMSKAFAMTGWRIGYAVADKNIIAAVNKLQSHQTSNPTSFCQVASVTGLNGDLSFMEDMRVEFEKRRNYMHERLSAISGMECFKAPGAFYLFPSIKAFIGKKSGSDEIKDADSSCNLMLTKNKVACVPGNGFGAPQYIRLSYAVSMDDIKEGLNRVEEFVNSLK